MGHSRGLVLTCSWLKLWGWTHCVPMEEKNPSLLLHP